jgi:hypothetical protein
MFNFLKDKMNLQSLKHIFFILRSLLFPIQERRAEFKFYEEALQYQFPRGMMVEYNGIEFYVLDYSSSENFINKVATLNECKLYIHTEYFDIEKKEFLNKSFHEDFLRNRVKVNKAIEV